MVGPVLALEGLRGGRRGRGHVLRWLYGGWLALQLLFYFMDYDNNRRTRDWRPADVAALARHLLDLVVAQHFVLLVLVTPAFAAGAVTDEKTRGTLEHLLTSQLGPPAIVIGKLLARAAQVGLLALAALPVVALVGP